MESLIEVTLDKALTRPYYQGTRQRCLSRDKYNLSSSFEAMLKSLCSHQKTSLELILAWPNTV